MLVKFDSHDEAQEFIKREGVKLERYLEETDEACRLVEGLTSILCKDSCGGLVYHIQINYEDGTSAFLDASTVVGI
jgi:hypothetical protein